MPNGYGRRGGFGFRGMSPPWPFIGSGRGGLPRCAYFYSGAAWKPGWHQFHPQTNYPYYQSFRAMDREDEIRFLEEEAKLLKKQLEQIEKRIEEIKSREKEEK